MNRVSVRGFLNLAILFAVVLVGVMMLKRLRIDEEYSVRTRTVLNYLQLHKKARLADLFRDLNYSKTNIYGSLFRLRNDGLVLHQKKGDLWLLA